MRALTIIVIGLLTSFPAFGHDCSQALTIPRDWLAIEGELFPPGPKASTATVQAETAPPELRAQDIQFVVKRIKNWPWLSTFSTFGTDIQGDPRSPFILFGVDVAHALGFKMPDENTVYLPTVARLNAGIELLNMKLPPNQQIHFRFYEQSEANRHLYLEFLARGLLPLAIDREQVAVHDYSFHVAAILLNPAQALRMIGLVNDIAVPSLRSVKAAELKKNVRDWWERELDQALGFPTLMLGQIRSLRKENKASMLSPMIAYALGLRAAPRVRLLKAGNNRYDVQIMNLNEDTDELSNKQVLSLYVERRGLLKGVLKSGE